MSALAATQAGGTLLRPALLLSLVSIALVMAVVLFDIEAASPGDLSATHAADERLVGMSGCARCHGEAGGSMTRACATCHEAIDRQIAAATGFHGTLPDEADVERCERCHLEHHGAGFALVGERAFAAAGFADRDAFVHAGLEFALEGAHDDLACDACHALADAEILRAGERRFLGLDQTCTACHDDAHDGGLGTSCAACHGQEHAFPEAAEFVHDASFPLLGAHGDSACAACHETEGPLSLARVLSAPRPRGAVAEPRACATCHPSPHAEAFVEDVARRLGIEAERSCERCHDPETATGFTGDDATFERGLHVSTGFPLTAPHEAVACSACHARTQASAAGGELFAAFRAAYPGRDADSCAACHEDPHRGQFARPPFDAAGCLACHDRHAFVPAAFDAEQHAGTAFPLTGSHLAVGCFACHTEPEGGSPGPGHAANRFAGTPTECAGCHADAHRGFFARIDEPHAMERNRCDHCHGTEAFADARASFEHAAWTAFPLAGAHRTAACEACHVPAPRPDVNGRRFGFAAATDCAGCHADPHAGQLARDGATDCARCHVPAAFDDLRRFDHARETRFALDETHAAVACSSCHLPQPVPGGGRLVRYRPLGMQCADCHDPRGGGGR